jgi:hypothetical protein
MVVAELLCTVIATSGNKSFTVLNFISFHLFSKNLSSATDQRVTIDICRAFR